MQGIYGASKNVVVMAATNIPQALDSALLRPGRFDFILEVPLPDEEGILKNFTERIEQYSL